MLRQTASGGVDIRSWRGDWALVTGASEGLGMAFARELAKGGLSLVLVARNETRLLSLAAELEQGAGIKTLVLARDLSFAGAAEELVGAIRSRGIRVRLLINNAARVQWGPLEGTSPETLLGTVQLNITTIVQLCYLLHKDLSSFPTSAIVMVASTGAHFVTPFMVNYTASKAFLKSFGLGLHSEWESQGILVQTLLPGVIETNMNARAGFSTRVLANIENGNPRQKPETVVAVSLQGLARGAPLVYTRWKDVWIGRLAAFVPVQFLVRVGRKIFSPTAAERSGDETPPAGAAECSLCGFRADPPPGNQIGRVRGNTERFKETWFRIWKCPACGTVHSIDPVDFADIYRDYPLNGLSLDGFARVSMGNLLRRLRRAGLKKEHRVLDYGCGNGRFLDFLKLKGWGACVGYDPFLPAFATEPEGLFDCVVFNDVIEHVPDPRAALRRASSFVKPGGLFYIGTPDSAPIAVDRLERSTTALHQPFHRVLLTGAGLDRLGEETGFDRVARYRRSYLDTLVPFCNYRVFDEYSRTLGHNLNAVIANRSPWIFFKTPPLLFFAFFGYWFPSAEEPALILRRPTGKPQ
ncbi:MAG: SDR family NAD(P)-dependent oxidoreductase [Elusimicrobia bacterium]|nr:SDR family NAD(P)-dependent oxidoreductase [Elusimicrobiota bacterium]